MLTIPSDQTPSRAHRITAIGTLDQDGDVTFQILVPNNAQLIGVEIYWQAAFKPSTGVNKGFSNLQKTTISS